MEVIEPSEADLNYMGYDDIDSNPWDLECPYIRDYDWDSARSLRRRLFRHHKYTHLLVKLTLPISYANLEIGSIVKLEDLAGGLKAFGIDYTKVTYRLFQKLPKN